MPGLTRRKARKILRDKSVRGRKLTRKQRGFFGARAGGTPVRRTNEAKEAVRQATA